MSVALPSNTTVLAPPAGASDSVPPRLAADWLIGLYGRWRWFFLTVLVGFYLVAFTGRWQPEPDSALYLSIGRNLAEGRGYTYLGEPHALAYPGMPYVIAATFATFGIGAEWAAHLVVLLIALASLGLLYRLFYLHTDPRTAVFLTCMVGMSFTLFRYAFELRNDVPFTAGVIAFLVGLESWRRACAGTGSPAVTGADDPAVAVQPKVPASPARRRAPWYDTFLMLIGLPLAMIMRPHAWVLLAAIAGAGLLALVRGSRPRVLTAVLAAGLAALVIAIVAIDPRYTVGTYEADIVRKVAELTTPAGWKVLAANAWELVDSTLAEAALGHQLGPGLTVAFGVVMLVLSVGLIRRRRVWGLFVIGTLLMVLIALPAPRYMLPVLPLLALAWFGAMVRINRRLGRPWGNVVFVIMLAVWVVPNFLKITKLVAEQRSSAFAEKYGDARAHRTLRSLAASIEREVEPEAFVIGHRKVARVLAYWSNRNVAAPYELPASAVSRPWYLLQPVDKEVQDMMNANGLRIGREVVRLSAPPTRRRRHGEDWVVSRLLEPVEPALAPAPAKTVTPAGSGTR